MFNLSSKWQNRTWLKIVNLMDSRSERNSLVRKMVHSYFSDTTIGNGKDLAFETVITMFQVI